MNDDKTLADFLPKLNTEGELILGEPKSSISKVITKQEVIDKILLIDDPELGINIYDLGLIYDLKIINNNIDVLMTLTTVNCPVADSMPNDIAKKIAEQGHEVYSLQQLNGVVPDDEYVQQIIDLNPDVVYFEMLDAETFKIVEKLNLIFMA